MMLIREVEKLTGIKDVNIRYYEKEGLIHPERKPNGYREYSEEDVHRIRQIKTLRLLDIPVPMIKKVLAGEISLQEVMKKKLQEVSEEESRIREIRNSCEAIIAGDIHIDELSEEILCGSRATWKARLEEIMKQDIDKRFIGKAFIYTVVWAIFTKLVVSCSLFSFTSRDGASFWEMLNLYETSLDIYIIWGVGIFLLLYGIGLSIFEGLSGKGFLWVWAENWGATGLGGLANSFAFCGIGIGIIGTSMIRFFVLLLAVCVVLAAIRGGIMYLQSARREKPAPKTGRTMALVSVILLLAFAASVMLLRKDYISKNPESNTDEQVIKKEGMNDVEITKDNWEDYFELVDEVKYEKNADGEVIAIYQESWFDLKEEYQNRLDEETDNEATFVCKADVKLKEYKITDPKTGEYEIIGDGPEIKYKGKTDRKTAIWESGQKGVIVERYVGEEPYLYTYDQLEVLAVTGTIHFNYTPGDF